MKKFSTKISAILVYVRLVIGTRSIREQDKIGAAILDLMKQCRNSEIQAAANIRVNPVKCIANCCPKLKIRLISRIQIFVNFKMVLENFSIL